MECWKVSSTSTGQKCSSRCVNFKKVIKNLASQHWKKPLNSTLKLWMMIFITHFLKAFISKLETCIFKLKTLFKLKSHLKNLLNVKKDFMERIQKK